jgi:hypothetical protein
VLWEPATVGIGVPVQCEPGLLDAVLVSGQVDTGPQRERADQPRKAHRDQPQEALPAAPLLPNAADFLVSPQCRLSVRPGERRRHVSGVAHREAGPGDLLLISPGNGRDVAVLDADLVEGLCGWSRERRGRSFVQEDVQEWLLFRGEQPHLTVPLFRLLFCFCLLDRLVFLMEEGVVGQAGPVAGPKGGRRQAARQPPTWLV